MTPGLRAARDRIAAWMDPDKPSPFPTLDVQPFTRDPTWAEVFAIVSQRDALIRSLIAPDLKAVLAALDQQPDGLITFAHELTEAEFEAFKQWWRTRHVAARHDGTLRVLDHDCGRDHPNADQMCYPVTRAPSIDPGMSILGESYEERRDAYRAARREQHPKGDQ